MPGDHYRERVAALMARLCRAHGLRRTTYEGDDAADSPNDTSGDPDAASEADLQLSLAL